ncbi:MAG: cytochrome c [Deltaproteobacteria bacterium]|nr:cytochrome c [Deltaproteobacteria bacterium]
MQHRLLSGIMVAGALLWTGAGAYADGAATYAAKCKMCHGADGKGNAAMKVPAFSGAEAAMQDTVAKGKGKMPAFAGKLSDAEIADVVKHIKTLK